MRSYKFVMSPTPSYTPCTTLKIHFDSVVGDIIKLTSYNPPTLTSCLLDLPSDPIQLIIFGKLIPPASL